MRQGPHKKLYDSAAWKRRRRALLDEEPLCRLCTARGRIAEATVADHVEPHRGDLGKFYHGALQPLCSTCHSGAKQSEELGRGLRGCDELGVPLDRNHHWNS